MKSGIDRRSVDRLLRDQRVVFDLILGQPNHDNLFVGILLGTFVGFSAVAQLVGLTVEEQQRMVGDAFVIVDQVLDVQGGRGKYGRTLQCLSAEALKNHQTVLSLAQNTLESAKKILGEASLMPHHGGKEKILLDRLLEFAAASRLIAPDLISQRKMMELVTTETARVIESGYLTRNEIRIT